MFPEFDGADDEHLAVVAASLPSGGRIVVRNGRLASSRPDNWRLPGSTLRAACGRAAKRCGKSRSVSGAAGQRCRWSGSR